MGGDGWGPSLPSFPCACFFSLDPNPLLFSRRGGRGEGQQSERISGRCEGRRVIAALLE